MDSTQEFRLKLTEVASELDIERLARLKYLCYDFIPGGDLEKIKTPEHLFLELEQRKVIEPHRLKFLADRLDIIGRKDLADDLRNNEREKIRGRQIFSYGQSRVNHFTFTVRKSIFTFSFAVWVTGHLATREFRQQPTRHQGTTSPRTNSPPSQVTSPPNTRVK